MKCTNCGNTLIPGKKFCTKCGAKVIEQEKATHSMQCPSCGNTLIPGKKFCTKCGAKVVEQSKAAQPMLCPSCGNTLIPGKKFCTKCGTKVMEQGIMQDAEKGFFSRVGAGVASMATGGSFSQGYAQQRDRENDYETLRNMADYALKTARTELKRLIKEHKDAVSYDDEVEVNDIIAKIENALNDRNASHGDKNTVIKNAVAALQNKMSNLCMRAEGGNTVQQGAQQNVQQGTQQSNTQTSSWGRNLDAFNNDELNIVRNKAIWGLQPGQIARRITERELDSIAGLNGFIIQEGCEAMIFVNGYRVETMEAGAYNVAQRNEYVMKLEFDRLYAEMEEQELEKQNAAQRLQPNAGHRGIVGISGALLRRGWEFVFGASPAKKAKANHENEARLRRLKAEVEKALKIKSPEPIMSIILVSKRNLSMSFGGVKSDNGIDYTPYTIPVGIFNVQIGLMLQLKVSDIKDFAANYLADRLTCTTGDLFDMLNVTIENCLVQNLRNADYRREGLAPAMVENLKWQITSIINQQLYGVECTQVLQITDSNTDFEHFRDVERELYCTDKELDYLQRTGEFRNRLAVETNRQTVQEATTDEQLRYALQQINKDQLLHDDELEQFVLLLNAQKRIREARSEEDERQAYIDLKKSALVKDEELEVLQDALDRNKIQRDSITEILRIQNMQSVSDACLKAEWALSDMEQNHEWEREDLARRRSWGIEDEARERQWLVEDQQLQRDMKQDMMRAQQENAVTDVEINTARKLDDYQLEKENRQREADWKQRMREENLRRENETVDFDRARQLEADKFERLQALQRQAMENMRAMQEGNLREKQEDNRCAEEMLRIQTHERMNRDNLEAGMGAAEIAAKRIAELQGEGQVALSQALEGRKQNELLQKMLEQTIADKKDDAERTDKIYAKNQEAMIKMAQLMQLQSQQRYDDVQAVKNEYRENAMHQQSRIDANNEVALGNMAQIGQAAAGNLYTNNTNINYQQTSPQGNNQPMLQSVQPQPSPAGKVCPVCGSMNPADELFCGDCGCKL